MSWKKSRENEIQRKNKNVPSYRSKCFPDFGTSDLRSKVDAFEESLFPIFVAWEQVLDTSDRASIQHAATKVTNMDYYIP